MKKILFALILAGGVALSGDSIVSSIVSLLGQHTSTVPVGSGSASASVTCNGGGTAFSQCGFIHNMGGTNTSGYFENQQAGALPLLYASLFDYLDGADRIEIVNGPAAPVLLNPEDGFVGVGPVKNSTPQALSVAGNQVTFDPSSVASDSLTNGTFSGSGTSWTRTNDCNFGTSSAVCAFSAGTASTISQASGTLAIAGVGTRMYRYGYTVSALAGTPSASIASSFANTIGTAALANLDLTSNGAKAIYFMSVASPGAFTVQTTLTAGQAFTLAATSLKQITGGNQYVEGLATAQTFGTATNCSSPGGTCGSAAAGSFTVAATATTATVSTTAVTQNSIIVITFDSSLGTKLGSITCNVTIPSLYGVTARTPGASFTVSATASAVNPACFNYFVIN